MEIASSYKARTLEELIFCAYWTKEMNYESLSDILKDSELSQRDVFFVGNIICWLGTNIGFTYLDSLEKAFKDCKDIKKSMNQIRVSNFKEDNLFNLFCEGEPYLERSEKDSNLFLKLMKWVVDDVQGQSFILLCETEINKYRSVGVEGFLLDFYIKQTNEKNKVKI